MVVFVQTITPASDSKFKISLAHQQILLTISQGDKHQAVISVEPLDHQSTTLTLTVTVTLTVYSHDKNRPTT